MNFIGFIFYESLPFAYAAFSMWGFMHRETSMVAGVAAVALAICSYIILMKRYEYRTYTAKNYTSR